MLVPVAHGENELMADMKWRGRSRASSSSEGAVQRDAGARPALARAGAAGAGPLALSVGALSRWLGALLVTSIRVYQWTLAPLFGNCCRFEPSCSRYTLTCIERWGPLRGSWLGLRRLSRCHPFCPGGHDPPPELTF